MSPNSNKSPVEEEKGIASHYLPYSMDDRSLQSSTTHGPNQPISPARLANESHLVHSSLKPSAAFSCTSPPTPLRTPPSTPPRPTHGHSPMVAQGNLAVGMMSPPMVAHASGTTSWPTTGTHKWMKSSFGITGTMGSPPPKPYTVEMAQLRHEQDDSARLAAATSHERLQTNGAHHTTSDTTIASAGPTKTLNLKQGQEMSDDTQDSRSHSPSSFAPRQVSSIAWRKPPPQRSNEPKATQGSSAAAIGLAATIDTPLELHPVPPQPPFWEERRLCNDTATTSDEATSSQNILSLRSILKRPTVATVGTNNPTTIDANAYDPTGGSFDCFSRIFLKKTKDLFLPGKQRTDLLHRMWSAHRKSITLGLICNKDCTCVESWNELLAAGALNTTRAGLEVLPSKIRQDIRSCKFYLNDIDYADKADDAMHLQSARAEWSATAEKTLQMDEEGVYQPRRVTVAAWHPRRMTAPRPPKTREVPIVPDMSSLKRLCVNNLLWYLYTGRLKDKNPNEAPRKFQQFLDEMPCQVEWWSRAEAVEKNVNKLIDIKKRLYELDLMRQILKIAVEADFHAKEIQSLEAWERLHFSVTAINGLQDHEALLSSTVDVVVSYTVGGKVVNKLPPMHSMPYATSIACRHAAPYEANFNPFLNASDRGFEFLLYARDEHGAHKYQGTFFVSLPDLVPPDADNMSSWSLSINAKHWRDDLPSPSAQMCLRVQQAGSDPQYIERKRQEAKTRLANITKWIEKVNWDLANWSAYQKKKQRVALLGGDFPLTGGMSLFYSAGVHFMDAWRLVCLLRLKPDGLDKNCLLAAGKTLLPLLFGTEDGSDEDDKLILLSDLLLDRSVHGRETAFEKQTFARLKAEGHHDEIPNPLKECASFKSNHRCIDVTCPYKHIHRLSTADFPREMRFITQTDLDNEVEDTILLQSKWITFQSTPASRLGARYTGFQTLYTATYDSRIEVFFPVGDGVFTSDKGVVWYGTERDAGAALAKTVVFSRQARLAGRVPQHLLHVAAPAPRNNKRRRR